MDDYFYRTEDIRPDEVKNYLVETKQDREIIDALKNRNASILVGSRGVGKSFLLRVAQQELLTEFEENGVFPVYLSFVKSSLLNTDDRQQFKHWMLAKIASSIIRSLRRKGLLAKVSHTAALISGSSISEINHKTKIEEISEQYEESWQKADTKIDVSQILGADQLKDALEDLCDELEIKRFVLLIDEAAHIFSPENQRQFFTLFRDLRSYCLTCNAAVYPGVTSYGSSFQSAHDATMIQINRDFLSKEYLENMQDIVAKQASSTILRNINSNKENFAILAYAASGNPRLLLKTIAEAPKVNSREVNEIIREFYRTDIWAEHTGLGEKYSGHEKVVDWGREFLESTVIPALEQRNKSALAEGKDTSTYIWVHRNAPEAVKEAMRILSYTGLVSEDASGIKATRAEIGTRYSVNLGALFSVETVPTRTCFAIAKNLTPKRMVEYGANHSSFEDLVKYVETIPIVPSNFDLQQQLSKPIDELDVSDFQMRKLKELKLETIKDVLSSNEQKLQEAFLIGPVRSRQMRNAAVSAVLEYLSG